MDEGFERYEGKFGDSFLVENSSWKYSLLFVLIGVFQIPGSWPVV